MLINDLDFPALLLLLGVVFFFGHYLSKSRRRVRQLGVLLGTLTFLGCWLFRLFKDDNLPLISYVFIYLLYASAVTATVWLVVSLLLNFLRGPLDLIGSTLGSSFRFLQPRINDAVSTQGDKRSQKKLQKARRRITELERLPDKMPENFDELATLVIEWSQRRESVMRKGEDVRKLLDNYDAVYSRQLVEVLERQEQQHNGRS